MTTANHAADTLQKDIAKLADDLVVLAQALRDGAAGEVQEKLAAIRGKAKLDAGVAFVRDQPLTSLTICFAVGWVAGRLGGR